MLAVMVLATGASATDTFYDSDSFDAAADSAYTNTFDTVTLGAVDMPLARVGIV